MVRDYQARRRLSPCAGCAAAVCVVCLLAGCRLPGRGPVSGSVLTCRQLTQRGISAVQRGDWAGAETFLGQAIQSCPVDVEARRHYAEVLWHRGAQSEALAQVEEALRLSSDDPTLLVRAGEMHLAAGRVEPAMARADEALDLNPEAADAWTLRGRIYRHTGQTRQALADFHRALVCEPGHRDVLLEVAELYRGLDQPQRALLALQTLQDSFPAGEEPQQVLHLTGLAYTALGRFDDAAHCLRTAASRGQPTAEILFRLAEAELRAGRPAEARAAAQQVLSLEPRHQAGQALLAHLAAASAAARR